MKVRMALRATHHAMRTAAHVAPLTPALSLLCRAIFCRAPLVAAPQTIVPTLVQGLIQMAIQRPSDPHLWLSEFLLQKSPQADDYEIRRKP